MASKDPSWYFIGIVAIFGGAFLAQYWPPALGIGLILYGLIGVITGQLMIRGILSRFLRHRAERSIGGFAILLGIYPLHPSNRW